MPLIQITNTYSGDVLEIVKKEVPDGFSIRLLSENTTDALCDAVADADYILASGRVKINMSVLEKANKLKMIQRTGVGLDSLDLDAIKSRNIPIYVNSGINTESVAEHTILLILASLRRLTEINRTTKSGIWKKQAQGIRTRELSGRTVGIIGMGNIGQRTARLLKVFGADVRYYDEYRLKEDKESELGIQYSELDKLFEASDIITLHCPLTDSSRYIINIGSMSSMKDGVIIVNTARGKLINEADLVNALKKGKVGFAGIDVYEEEPPVSTELSALDNVIMTPHIAGVTYDSFRCMMHDAMDNMRRYEAGLLDDIEQYRLKQRVLYG